MKKEAKMPKNSLLGETTIGINLKSQEKALELASEVVDYGTLTIKLVGGWIWCQWANLLFYDINLTFLKWSAPKGVFVYFLDMWWTSIGYFSP